MIELQHDLGLSYQILKAFFVFECLQCNQGVLVVVASPSPHEDDAKVPLTDLPNVANVRPAQLVVQLLKLVDCLYHPWREGIVLDTVVTIVDHFHFSGDVLHAVQGGQRRIITTMKLPSKFVYQYYQKYGYERQKYAQNDARFTDRWYCRW